MDLDRIKQNMPNNDIIGDIANLFKVLGDSTRSRILYTLKNNELCVGDICECLDMTKSAISHQLRVLRQAKLVKSRKDGKEVFYSLDDEHVNQIFTCALEHINE